MKYLFVILISITIFSCKEKKDLNTTIEIKELSFEELIYSKINDFIYSSMCERKKVVEVRHQKYKNKEYIQISAQEKFITDSLYTLNEYKNYLIAFYNEDFFKNIIKKDSVKNDSIINKNYQWNFNTVGSLETGYPCFDMYEKKGNSLIAVESHSYEYNNLFIEPPMFPEPEPPARPIE